MRSEPCCRAAGDDSDAVVVARVPEAGQVLATPGNGWPIFDRCSVSVMPVGPSSISVPCAIADTCIVHANAVTSFAPCNVAYRSDGTGRALPDDGRRRGESPSTEPVGGM